MKQHIINLGIFAHIDAGKTTFVERILFESGELTSPGSVEDGTTEMDTLAEEISRGISITASTTQVRYKYKKEQYFLNLVDTPGHLDFHSQVDSALLAIDLAVLLIDVTAGIRSQTEMIAEKLKKKNIPIIVYFNKIDRLREFEPLLNGIRRLFPEKKLCSLFIPHLEEKFDFVFETREVNEDLELPLIDWSEELTEKYFKAKDIKRLILNGIKQGLPRSAFIPALAGSALYGEGVKEFLHFITFFQPEFQEKEEKCILFKRQIHPILGKVLYVKTFSIVHRGDLLFFGNEFFKLEKLFQIIPGGVHELEYVSGNNIFVFPVGTDVSFPDLHVGDILTDKPTESPMGERQSFSREFAVIIEPIKEESREDLRHGLEQLVWEDIGLSFLKRPDTGQWELRGMGELHLEVALERLKFFIGEIFHVKNLRVAKYAICKTMAKKVIFEHSTSDGKWKSGTIRGFLEARTDFENTVYFETDINLAIKLSIESAFQEILSHGWQGYPVLGLSLRVTDYSPPDVVDEHTLSLVKVSVISSMKAMIQSNSTGIGPVARIEIIVPQAHFGAVVSLLNKRGVKVHSLEVIEGDRSLVKAEAPAENLLGFQSALRNMTQGKGQLSIDTAFSYKDYSEISA
jgi:elongation factor G